MYQTDHKECRTRWTRNIVCSKSTVDLIIQQYCCVTFPFVSVLSLFSSYTLFSVVLFCPASFSASLSISPHNCPHPLPQAKTVPTTKSTIAPPKVASSISADATFVTTNIIHLFGAPSISPLLRVPPAHLSNGFRLRRRRFCTLLSRLSSTALPFTARHF